MSKKLSTFAAVNKKALTMKARILYVLLCGAMYFCSTPFGMAQEAVREDVRAEMFAGEVAGSKEDRLAAVSFNDAGLLSVQVFAEQSETSADGEDEARREQRRTISFLKFHSHNCLACSLSRKTMSKGVAKHPGNQDAGQERTAMVRFLQLASLVC